MPQIPIFHTEEEKRFTQLQLWQWLRLPETQMMLDALASVRDDLLKRAENECMAPDSVRQHTLIVRAATLRRVIELIRGSDKQEQNKQ